ncbi:TPR 1 and TPR 11 and RPAP3 C and Mss4 domain cont aining protein [Trichuris trichiura]|uniref:RNA polymerase II-associated protein 3 n=1 Tax=Trichuris trichiura TaxID=36087 RepID=A0A077Z9C4_TRITR|nr:TPR 1 and TPR 11 and RPAP3 C and Mss4 domain cont aining protein [Trichuris trichiura]
MQLAEDSLSNCRVELTNRLCAVLRCKRNSTELHQRLEELSSTLVQLRHNVHTLFRGLESSPEEQIRELESLYQELLVKDRLIKHLKMSASILQSSETMDSNRANANKNQSNEVSSGALSCPKCSSLILNAGLGKRVFMKRSLPELTLKADGGVNLQVLSEFVRVDDIYTFQNIGFSRNAGDVRYLLCADCEIGPLGIFEPKTELSFVAVERVVVDLKIIYPSFLKGNAQYGKKEYAKAIMHYSRAVQADPSDPISYCNRAMALLKLARYEEASKDCGVAISLDCKYVKAYFRRGLALKELGRHREAVDDFQSVLLLEPDNHLADEELKKLSKSELVVCSSVESLLARCKIDEKEFDEPLRQIPIRYATEAESTNHIGNKAKRNETSKAEVAQEPSLDSGPAEICPIPSNIRQMLVDWKSLRNDSQSLCNYILNIPLSRFQKLFDNFLSIAELSDLLNAFERALDDEVKLQHCIERLMALTTSRRFGSASVFLMRQVYQFHW